jgi:hypothetical protein
LKSGLLVNISFASETSNHSILWNDENWAVCSLFLLLFYHSYITTVFHQGWGGGFEEGTLKQFENYVTALHRLNVTSFDKVLIDGRARASCAEYVIPFLAEHAIVFVHDYVVRPHYHAVVDKHYIELARISTGQSLVVLKPR